jgi:hypothetical protein
MLKHALTFTDVKEQSGKKNHNWTNYVAFEFYVSKIWSYIKKKLCHRGVDDPCGVNFHQCNHLSKYLGDVGDSPFKNREHKKYDLYERCIWTLETPAMLRPSYLVGLGWPRMYAAWGLVHPLPPSNRHHVSPCACQQFTKSSFPGAITGFKINKKSTSEQNMAEKRNV